MSGVKASNVAANRKPKAESKKASYGDQP